jgi:eukaryotic-like serine/threonine-protein kinase
MNVQEVTGRAGAYRLVQHIASGGMGVVYLGERDDGQVRHQAAVKILRRGLDAEEQVRRFGSERQILARLEHPNIARLIDAGMSDDGRPYFVMEYVAGEPIDAYCDRRHLTVDERLALVQQVALAVDYAHHSLVVHRDLKPSNILVTSDGTVKLLDFGIAKVLELDREAETVATLPGVRMMTPEYASPEQVSYGLITTATDVYALGLLLYELLTGRRAQPADGRSSAEIEHAVLHKTVPRLSDAVATATRSLRVAADDPERAEQVARDRATTPQRLRRLLRGDLDQIVSMALRKEPERRYASARAFADDIRRYLKGEPILARGESAGYRMRKFARRRWPAVAFGAALLLLLVAYAVTATIQARAIAAERDRARAEQAKAEEVTRFLMKLFEASDPSESRGDTITARELLARGVARVDALNGQPAVQGQLLDGIGRVYMGLGQYEQAQSVLERALNVRSGALGATHPDVADTMSSLGELARLRSRLPDADRHLRQALALHEAATGRNDAKVATDLQRLAATAVDRGDPREGKRLYEEALAVQRLVLPANDPEIAESIAGLGYVASRTGDFAEMERRHQESLELLRRSYGERHPRVALAINNLASALDSRGNYAESERLHREALAMRRQLFGEEHPAVATSLNNLAKVLQSQQKYTDAEPLAVQVVDLRRRLLGPNHASTGTALNNLGALYMRLDKLAEAEAALLEACEIARKNLGERHQFVYVLNTNLAAVYAKQGRMREAEQLYRESLDGRTRVLGAEHIDVSNSLFALGKFLGERRRHAEAEPVLAHALAMRKKLLGDAHPETVKAAQELDRVSIGAGAVP